ncbi:hypothetical protein [Streptomyces violascens]|uniref:hypothetical protein n=1 Tax=Streptomyces violascens TaxID=67381 RepID=UPI001671EFCA|nr:hypothetical protein [Streptomyces violascens]GGU51210.1 hypothetical protein GCM10010289_84550 [Streptomyces violascens]
MTEPAPWSVVYSETGRAALSVATPQERAAILALEARLALDPYACGEIYPDRIGNLYLALLEVGGRLAWTSVLYRIDEGNLDEGTRGEALIVAVVSGP